MAKQSLRVTEKYMRGKRHTEGFTLIELIVVIGIAGIILGVMLFNYNRGKQTIALDNSVSMMVTDLRRQRQRTITTETNCGIRILNNGYVRYEENPFSGVKGAPINFSELLGVNVNISSPPVDSVVEFRPEVPEGGDWAPLQSDLNTIIIQCGNHSRKISISASGEIKLD